MHRIALFALLDEEQVILTDTLEVHVTDVAVFRPE